MHAARVVKLQFKRNTAMRTGADASTAPDARLRFEKDELFHG